MKKVHKKKNHVLSTINIYKVSYQIKQVIFNEKIKLTSRNYFVSSFFVATHALSALQSYKGRVISDQEPKVLLEINAKPEKKRKLILFFYCNKWNSLINIQRRRLYSSRLFFLCMSAHNFWCCVCYDRLFARGIWAEGGVTLRKGGGVLRV